MTELQDWFINNPLLGGGIVIASSIGLFWIARWFVGRGLTYLVGRTETRYDDIVVRHLHPFRTAWLAPLLVIYAFAFLFPDYQGMVEKIALFLILWVVAITLLALLGALNEIYEASPSFTGVSVKGYLDIVKILILLIGVILSIALITGESPVVLLAGLGTITAILLLVFQNTILSIVASIQISANDLIKLGDWIEVPSYNADGDVIDISLHNIKVQNFDKTVSVIPTYKMIDVAYKNWRGMQESGGRRIKRAVHLDLHSITFCDRAMLDRVRLKVPLSNFLEVLSKYDAEEIVDKQDCTNAGLFQEYVEAYLRSRDDIHQEDKAFLIRQLAPGPAGLPLEIYVFTKTVDWGEFERIQAEIFEHLLAAVPLFELRLYQYAGGMIDSG